MHRVVNMVDCAFARLFSSEVVNIREENIHCSCPKAAQLSSNTPIQDYGFSDLLNLGCWENTVGPGLEAYLSFEDFLCASECSRRGLDIAIQRGRPRQMLDFLRISSGSKKLRWQRVKTRDCQSAVMKNKEIFWVKLRYQLYTYLSGLHQYSNEASLTCVPRSGKHITKKKLP